MSCCTWPWEQSYVVPSDAINVPNNLPPSVGSNSLFCEVVGASNCGDVMNAIARRLERRLHSSVLVTNPSTNQYTFSIRRGQSTATLLLTTTSGCAYPITASYSTTKDSSQSGSARFDSIDQLIYWASLSLK